MHELSIAEGILKIAKEEIEKRNLKRVLTIKLKVGEFSGVIPSIIQEYFNITATGTCVEGAKIIIDKVPITIKCNSCSAVSEINRMKIKCPKCSSTDIKMLTGREFYVDSMEVE